MVNMLDKLIPLFLVADLCFAASPNVFRPCAPGDNECVRLNLEARSNCNPNVKGMPSVHIIEQFPFEVPHFASSYIDDIIVRNHDKCFVSEFFFNFNKNLAVLSVDCPMLDLEANRTRIQHRSLDEDTFYTFHVREIYPLVRMTLNLPNISALDICTAFVSSEVTIPDYDVIPYGPPPTGDPNDLQIFETEMFLYKGPPIALDYINREVCDFGCSYMPDP